ncbi:MAG: hypothetical protein ACJA2W_001243 [Planctomycetota bacterium]|jgi:hypothetical protein
MRKIFQPALCVVAAALSMASCRSTSEAYQFSPSPLEVLVTQSDEVPILARVLVGIPGAEREGGARGGWPELLVRLRIENRSANSIRFDPSRSTLLGSDLAEFGSAKAEPAGITEVAAGRTESLLVRYPFPHDGDLSAPLLTGVNLRFELDLGGGQVSNAAGAPMAEAASRKAVVVSATLERTDQRDRYNSRNSVYWGTGWRGGWGPGLGNNWGFGFASNNYYGCW